MSKWISVGERLPDPDSRVEICYRRHNAYYDKDYRIVTCAVWEDGGVYSDYSRYIGNDNDWLYEVKAEFNEEQGDYLIPKGWYEVMTGIGSEYVCALEDEEVVTHWREIEYPEENDDE